MNGVLFYEKSNLFSICHNFKIKNLFADNYFTTSFILNNKRNEIMK